MGCIPSTTAVTTLDRDEPLMNEGDASAMAPVPKIPDPIDALPPELLTQIFTHVVNSDAMPPKLRAVHSLSLVSRAWAAVVQQNPMFWTAISSNIPPLLNQKALEISQGHPLDLTYVREDESRETRQFRDFLEQAPRWRNARFTFVDRSGDGENFAALLAAPKPLLEELVVTFTLDEPTGQDLVKGNAPQLRRLTLDGVEIPSNSDLLKNLHSLCLISARPSPFSADELANVLLSCPDLVELIIHSAESDFTSPSTNIIPIPLLCLESIDLRLPTEPTRQVLSRLRLPKACNLSFAPPLWYTEPIDCFLCDDTALHLVENLGIAAHREQGECLTARFECRFDISTVDCKIRSGSNQRLHISCREDAPEMASLFWLLGKLQCDAGGIEVELALHHPRQQHIDIAKEIMSTLHKSVVELSIFPADEPARHDIMLYLAERQEDVTVRFPALRTISFDGTYRWQMDRFLQTLEARAYGMEQRGERRKLSMVKISSGLVFRGREDVKRFEEVAEAVVWC